MRELHECSPGPVRLGPAVTAGWRPRLILPNEAQDDAIPLTACPRCGVWVPDLDGFGVLYHEACGYCQHASVTGDRCGLCGEVVSVLEAAKRYE